VSALISRSRGSSQLLETSATTPVIEPPLSRNLRESTPLPAVVLREPSLNPFGGPGEHHHGRFPERHQLAVLLPERFRGGCSFGAGSIRPDSPASVDWLCFSLDLQTAKSICTATSNRADFGVASELRYPAFGRLRSKPTRSSYSAGRVPSGISNDTVRTTEKYPIGRSTATDTDTAIESCATFSR